MFPLRFIKTLFSLILLASALGSTAAAQCEGVYFKTVKPRVFSERVRFFNGEIQKDLTGDGKADLIGYGYNDNSLNIEKVYILPNDGQGGFNSPLQTISLPTTIAFGSVFVADFNTDGKNDIIVKLESNPASVLVYRNNGNGSFTPLAVSSISNSETILNVVDINNDGIADLLTLWNHSGVYYYRFGRADGTFGTQIHIAPAIYQIAADFNNDGKVDFPFVSPNRQLKIYYNQGNGVFFPGNDAVNIENVSIREARDLNNDGKIDLLAQTSNSSIAVIKNLGNDTFSRKDYPFPPYVFPNFSLNSMQLADFNGDGFLDIFGRFDAAASYSVYMNDGTADFIRRDYNYREAGVPFGDVDGDNKADLVRINNFNVFNQNNTVRLFNETQLSVQKNVCNVQGQTKIVDFDRDKTTDKTLWQPGDGRWLYRQTLSPRSTISFSWGLNGDITTPGDYDGDGVTDHAVFRPSNGVWYIRKSSDQSFIFTQFGLSSDKPVASDYDGDGKTDIAVYRPSDGNWYVFNSATQTVSIARFGIAEDKPLPEDYDGDGKSDLAVFRPSTGVWYYLKSSDGNFAAIKWGIATDKPVPADYDGDGKADLAVFRESEGNWYILRSFNFQYGVFRFGSSGDVPQPGDWDGNGITDLGIYRPGTRGWYSSDNIEQVTFGSAGEIPTSYILKPE